MKRLNEVEMVNQELEHEVKIDMLTNTLLDQIRVVERLMESHVEWVESPVAYNMVVGLVEQLKYYAPAAFQPAEMTLNREIHPNNNLMEKPKFGSLL